MIMQLDVWLQRVWYQQSHWKWLLAPLSLLFAVAVLIRRCLYRWRLLKSIKVAVPVVVVGNITVGGTGKTPLVMWLAALLREQGLKPGIITRGYRGQSVRWPLQVTADTDPRLAGDEAVILATHGDAIVVAGPDRVVDAEHAIALGANVIIADDGLQHYRLSRDVEVVVVDAERELGNGWYLPAGPLREGASRLYSVDAVMVHHRAAIKSATAVQATKVSQFDISSELGEARCLATGEQRSLSTFVGQRVHALAGIGNPETFFAALRRADLTVDAKPLADHAMLTRQDIAFADDAPVLMTEKDAVKCRTFADPRCWSVALKLSVSAQDRTKLLELLNTKLRVS
jgi:tetraacyldisaccharide 4'-kinase